MWANEPKASFGNSWNLVYMCIDILHLPNFRHSFPTLETVWRWIFRNSQRGALGTTGISFGLHCVRGTQNNYRSKASSWTWWSKPWGLNEDDDADDADEDEAYRRSYEKLHTVKPWKKHTTWSGFVFCLEGGCDDGDASFGSTLFFFPRWVIESIVPLRQGTVASNGCPKRQKSQRIFEHFPDFPLWFP